MHDVRVLDLLPVEAGSIYVMDRGYIDYKRLFALHQAGAFFVTRAKETMDARRVYSLPADRTRGIVCDQRVRLNGFYAGKHYPEHLRRIRYREPETGRTLVFLNQQHGARRNDHLRALQMPLAGGTVLQVDQAASAHQAIPGHQRKRRQNPNLGSHFNLCARSRS